MPQISIEYSDNVLEKNNIVSVLSSLHRLLAEILPTDINSCKSRAYENAQYLVGDGDAQRAFIHATLKVLPNRHNLPEVGQQVLTELQSHFRQSLDEFKLQITLEITELSAHYFKFAS